MKKIFKYLAILASAAISFCACTDDSENVDYNNVGEGEKVILNLSYGAINPSVIVARSAATKEENKLNNLYVYVFSASDGKLKGFTKIEDASQLNQDGGKGDIKVFTTTGASHIYAVANYKKSNTVYTIDNLPTNINPLDAQAGLEDGIDLDGFKSLMFTRASGETLINEYLMAGSANEGNECIIADSDGMGYIADPTSDDGKLIKLHRIVSKVQFNIKAGNGVEFTPTKYDIINIPTKGSIVKGQSVTGNTFESAKDNVFSTQSRNSFEVKLPENLQGMKNSVSSWHSRETNTYVGGEITFDNAPDNGTYVVLYGKFKDETNKIEGDTHYYIHLGDCSSNVNDYNNERNCRYIYNVTVTNVNNIIVEAKKEGETPQPGAEGFILDYNAGKVFTLDSHYEYCVLKFSYDAIKKIKDDSNGQRGYVYQVKALGKETAIINVASANDTLNAQLNGVDISWIKFAQNDNVSDYNDKDSHGGKEFSYTATKNKTYGNSKNKGELLTVNALLLYLYNIADETHKDKWDNGYLTFTGYLNENYYQSLTWDQYTNIDPRVIYIADEVWTSSDTKSTYAKVAYGVSQYAIQTFYDRNNSSQLIAYGCETINDEKGKNVTQTNNPVSTTGRNDATDALTGRGNMKADFGWTAKKTWSGLDYSDLRAACMSRNRDLNRDGVIDDKEIRWYTPTVAQYTGLWIGEEALGNTDARLFTNNMADIHDIDSPNIMHYYTSTNGARTYWAEEGMAYGVQKGCKYIRCIRTLKSNDGTSDQNDNGYKETPDAYYMIDSDNKVISLENRVDEKALRTGTVMTGELPPHKERVNQQSPDPYNKPRAKFVLAEKRAGQVWEPVRNQWSWSGNASKFGLSTLLEGAPCAAYGQVGDENGRLVDKGTWRVPNQREFCLIELKSQAITFDAARTSYTGDYRYGYHKNNEVNMISDKNISNLTVRCVRDYEGGPTEPIGPSLSVQEITETKSNLRFYYYNTWSGKKSDITSDLNITSSDSNVTVEGKCNKSSKRWTVTVKYWSSTDISKVRLTFRHSYYSLGLGLSDFINSTATEYRLQ